MDWPLFGWVVVTLLAAILVLLAVALSDVILSARRPLRRHDRDRER